MWSKLKQFFLSCKRSDVDFYFFLQETHSGDVDETFWKT